MRPRPVMPRAGSALRGRVGDLRAEPRGLLRMAQRVVVRDEVAAGGTQVAHARAHLRAEDLVAGQALHRTLREAALTQQRAAELDAGDASVHVARTLGLGEAADRLAEQ